MPAIATSHHAKPVCKKLMCNRLGKHIYIIVFCLLFNKKYWKYIRNFKCDHFDIIKNSVPQNMAKFNKHFYDEVFAYSEKLFL